jgi:hypothetical protein
MKTVATITTLVLLACAVACGSVTAIVTTPNAQSPTTVMGMQTAPTVQLRHNIPESGLKGLAGVLQVEKDLHVPSHNVPYYGD